MQFQLTFENKEYTIKIDHAHYVRRLGYPLDYDVPDYIKETMDWAENWYAENGNPWLDIYPLQVVTDEEQLILNKEEITCEKLRKRFVKHQVKEGFLVAATAGNMVDEIEKTLWKEDAPDKAFFINAYAASVTEAIISFSVVYLTEWANKKNKTTIARYSPGYAGWELTEQFKLMGIIKKERVTTPLSINESAILSPLKSQLSVVGIRLGENKEKTVDIECMQCNFMDCSCKNQGLIITTK